MAKATCSVPEGYSTVTPALTFDDAAKAIDWCKKALGAEEIARAVGPDGKILHAELRIGSSRLMLGDAMMGFTGPLALFNRAVSAGAKVLPGMGVMADHFWGDRCGRFTDPHGYRWTIATHKEDLTPVEMKKRQDEWMKQFEKKMAAGA